MSYLNLMKVSLPVLFNFFLFYPKKGGYLVLSTVLENIGFVQKKNNLAWYLYLITHF